MLKPILYTYASTHALCMLYGRHSTSCRARLTTRRRSRSRGLRALRIQKPVSSHHRRTSAPRQPRTTNCRVVQLMLIYSFLRPLASTKPSARPSASRRCCCNASRSPDSFRRTVMCFVPPPLACSYTGSCAPGDVRVIRYGSWLGLVVCPASAAAAFPVLAEVMSIGTGGRSSMALARAWESSRSCILASRCRRCSLSRPLIVLYFFGGIQFECART